MSIRVAVPRQSVANCDLMRRATTDVADRSACSPETAVVIAHRPITVERRIRAVMIGISCRIGFNVRDFKASADGLLTRASSTDVDGVFPVATKDDERLSSRSRAKSGDHW